jgi:acetyltransferase
MASAVVLQAHLFSPITFISDEGHLFRIRHIEPVDFYGLKQFVEKLSFATKYLRFGHGDFQPDSTILSNICNPDTDVCTHLIISKGNDQQIVASGRYVLRANSNNAEFALEILDTSQHHGLGHHLLESLELDAQRRGVKIMHGQILATNVNMLNFVLNCGYTIHYHPEEEYLKLAIKAF